MLCQGGPGAGRGDGAALAAGPGHGQHGRGDVPQARHLLQPEPLERQPARHGGLLVQRRVEHRVSLCVNKYGFDNI